MKKIALLLSCIIYTSHVIAMKRSYDYSFPNCSSYTITLNPCATNTKAKALPPQIIPFEFQLLLPELQNIIIPKCYVKSTDDDNLRRTIITIRSLCLTSKKFNEKINEPKFHDEVVNVIARQFYCPHEIIARRLNTPTSKWRLYQQRQLLRLLRCNLTDTYITKELKRLIENGVNLEFVYNHHNRMPKTALMFCVFNYRNDRCSLLLQNGADINSDNTHGHNALTLAAMFPINLEFINIAIKHDKVDINKQNHRGETTLLQLLTNRLRYTTSKSFIQLIQLLLKAGANPKLAAKNGHSPLKAAKLLNNAEIIQLIENAIAQKSSNSDQK